MYCKLDEGGRKELIKQLMVKPKSSPKIKVALNQGSPVGLNPLDSIKRPHEPNP
ncbi:MAG: hypothetical protein C5S45_02275 [Candidatus Methanocomedens sp.]|nr:MAG: hypothetical protein C5S45_02275 [ANME-2 cluster archaeon]